jgi:hypothetical protein
LGRGARVQLRAADVADTRCVSRVEAAGQAKDDESDMAIHDDSQVAVSFARFALPAGSLESEVADGHFALREYAGDLDRAPF